VEAITSKLSHPFTQEKSAHAAPSVMMSHRIHISTKLGKWAGLPRYQVGLDICIHALKNMFPKTCRTSCTLLNSPIDFSIGLQMSVSSFLWEFRIHLLLQARANSSSSYTGSCGVFEATSISTKELASTAVRNVLTHGSPWLTRHSRRGRLVVLSVKIAEKNGKTWPRSFNRYAA